MGRKSINLQSEEALSIEVQKYPCLYDKNESTYKNVNVKANAWKNVDNELGYEEGESKKHFALLKKRYSKKKNALKRAKPSGTGRTPAFVKAEAAFNLYSFLGWLNPYIDCPNSLTNIDEIESEENGSHQMGDKEEEDDDDQSSDSDSSASVESSSVKLEKKQAI